MEKSVSVSRSKGSGYEKRSNDSASTNFQPRYRTLVFKSHNSPIMGVLFNIFPILDSRTSVDVYVVFVEVVNKMVTEI